MIGNKPSYDGLVQWNWDYFSLVYDGLLFMETYTFYSNGTFTAATGTYADGTIAGYIYLVYTDATKGTLSHGYGKVA